MKQQEHDELVLWLEGGIAAALEAWHGADGDETEETESEDGSVTGWTRGKLALLAALGLASVEDHPNVEYLASEVEALETDEERYEFLANYEVAAESAVAPVDEADDGDEAEEAEGETADEFAGRTWDEEQQLWYDADGWYNLDGSPYVAPEEAWTEDEAPEAEAGGSEVVDTAGTETGETETGEAETVEAEAVEAEAGEEGTGPFSWLAEDEHAELEQLYGQDWPELLSAYLDERWGTGWQDNPAESKQEWLREVLAELEGEVADPLSFLDDGERARLQGVYGDGWEARIQAELVERWGERWWNHPAESMRVWLEGIIAELEAQVAAGTGEETAEQEAPEDEAPEDEVAEEEVAAAETTEEPVAEQPDDDETPEAETTDEPVAEQPDDEQETVEDAVEAPAAEDEAETAETAEAEDGEAAGEEDELGWVSDDQRSQLEELYGAEWQARLQAELETRWGSGWQGTSAERKHEQLENLIGYLALPFNDVDLDIDQQEELMDVVEEASAEALDEVMDNLGDLAAELEMTEEELAEVIDSISDDELAAAIEDAIAEA